MILEHITLRLRIEGNINHLNSSNDIQEKIFKQVENDFPKTSDRCYGVKFAKY